MELKSGLRIAIVDNLLNKVNNFRYIISNSSQYIRRKNLNRIIKRSNKTHKERLHLVLSYLCEILPPTFV